VNLKTNHVALLHKPHVTLICKEQKHYCSNPDFINMIYEVLIESLRYLFDDDDFIVGD
jgi:hypothetical protein